MQQQRNSWEIISASEFEVPGSPPNEAARGQSRRLWRWILEEVLQWPEQVEAGGSTKSRDCSADELDISCNDIDWNLAARVLSVRARATQTCQWRGSAAPFHPARHLAARWFVSGDTGYLAALLTRRYQRPNGRTQDVAIASPYLNFDRPVIVVAAEQPWGTHYRLKGYPMDGRNQFMFITDLTLRGKEMLRRLGVKPAAATTVAPSSS